LNNPNAHDLIKAYEHYGQPIPEGLIPPDLQDVEWAYWQSFWELSTDRHIGMTSGPIPWSSIYKYLSANPGADLGIFLPIIRAMDEAYLSHESAPKRETPRR
jgi:hypothetical protein